MVIQLKDQEMAEKAIKFRLFLGGILVKAEKYRHRTIQCQKYQKFGHLTRECRLNYKCQICAEEHPIKAYKCDCNRTSLVTVEVSRWNTRHNTETIRRIVTKIVTTRLILLSAML